MKYFSGLATGNISLGDKLATALRMLSIVPEQPFLCMFYLKKNYSSQNKYFLEQNHLFQSTLNWSISDTTSISCEDLDTCMQISVHIVHFVLQLFLLNKKYAN